MQRRAHPRNLSWHCSSPPCRGPLRDRTPRLCGAGMLIDLSDKLMLLCPLVEVKRAARSMRPDGRPSQDARASALGADGPAPTSPSNGVPPPPSDVPPDGGPPSCEDAGRAGHWTARLRPRLPLFSRLHPAGALPRRVACAMTVGTTEERHDKAGGPCNHPLRPVAGATEGSRGAAEMMTSGTAGSGGAARRGRVLPRDTVCVGVARS